MQLQSRQTEQELLNPANVQLKDSGTKEDSHSQLDLNIVVDILNQRGSSLRCICWRSGDLVGDHGAGGPSVWRGGDVA